jgi:hypothetical protein
MRHNIDYANGTHGCLLHILDFIDFVGVWTFVVTTNGYSEATY